jgi:hypothetical protein
MNSSLTRTVLSSCSGLRQLRRGILGVAAGILALSVFLPSAAAQCGSANLTRGRVPVLPGAMLSTPRGTQAAGKDSAASRPSAKVSIVGLWQLNFLAGSEVVDVAFDAWHSDGTEILNDYTNPINGNVCLGTWKQTGSLTYKLTHPSWYFDNSGNLLGTEMLFENVTLSADGSQFSGTYLIDVYDTQGNLLETLSGTLSASRITP